MENLSGSKMSIRLMGVEDYTGCPQAVLSGVETSGWRLQIIELQPSFHVLETCHCDCPRNERQVCFLLFGSVFFLALRFCFCF